MDLSRFQNVMRSRGSWEGAARPATGLGARLIVAAEASGSSLAVVDEDRRVSYEELLAASRQFADGLAHDGVGAGDVVLAQLPNWWEALVVAYGTWLRGAVLCPVVTIYREHELNFIIRQAEPRVVVVPETYRGYEHSEALLRLSAQVPTKFRTVTVRGSSPGTTDFNRFGRDDGDPARVPPTPEPENDLGPDAVSLLLYTSGTTAEPKGVVHSAAVLLYEARSIAAVARLTGSDVVYMPSPLTHITGILYGVILPVDLRCPLILQARWDPEVAGPLVEREKATFTVSATPFLAGLTSWYQGHGTQSSLRVFICGGADVPAELVRRARRILGAAVVRTYGSSEMPTLCIGDPFGDADLSATTDGLLIAPARARVSEPVDGIGELEVQGPELFLGYLDQSLDLAAMTDDGWFKTGDLAQIRSDGAITIKGRIKDIINRGGEKFSAREIEEMLLEHPSVAEVAIVGLPDQALGERACAIVVPRPGTQPTLPELTAFLADRGVARQKFPERLEVVGELNKTASGKIQKFILRQQLM